MWGFDKYFTQSEINVNWHLVHGRSFFFMRLFPCVRVCVGISFRQETAQSRSTADYLSIVAAQSR